MVVQVINLTVVCIMNLQPNNPLHGKTLEAILTELVDHYGWERLGQKIRINCFVSNPSIKSSLTFLRKTDWARKQVEDLYLQMRS
ncbi:VF530 family protein [Spirosoma areae]